MPTTCRKPQNMVSGLKRKLIIILVFLSPLFAWGQNSVGSFNNPPQPPVTLSNLKVGFADPQSILKIEMGVQLPLGWHIYADTLSLSYLTPTGLQIDKNLGHRLRRLYPKPAIKKLLGEEVPLFEGTFLISEWIYLKKPVSFPVNLAFKYQACTDNLCLRPQTIKLKVIKDQKTLKIIMPSEL